MKRSARQSTTRLVRSPIWLGTGLIFALGFAVRLWFVLGAGAAFLGYPDSGGYIGAAGHDPLGGTELQPAGYPLFLYVIHAVTARLWVTTALQHLIGLGIAAIYFVVVKRVATVKAAALFAAVIVLFDGMELFFEQSVMSEVLVESAIAVSLFAAVKARGAAGTGWSLLAGAAVASAAVTRVAAVPLVVVLVGWLWLAHRRDNGFRNGLVAAASALVVLGAFVLAQRETSGVWGLARADGFNIYFRVSTFANCSSFRPPAGTTGLCARTPPPRTFWRPGPFIWACPGAPGICTFGDPAGASGKLRAFALAAIVHQPGDYISAVAKDLPDYIDPPKYYGSGDLLALLDNPVNEAPVIRTARSHYDLRTPFWSSRAGLDAYARAIHVGGGVIAVLLLGAVLSMFLTTGDARRVSVLFTLVGLSLLVVPVATVHFEPRFGLPATAPLAASTALALSSIVGRFRDARVGAGGPDLGQAPARTLLTSGAAHGVD